MCGIAGIANPRWGIPEISAKTIGLRSFLAHRGPDDAGLYAAEGIGLAHTRLSIIDLAGGHQPLTNERRSIFLVANGEIYNHRELRRALATQGHQFRTASDCEAIVHLYEQYGKDCVDHLEGMFAFALWDSREQTLLLARDRFGIKPLYFACLKDGLCFASELTAIAQSGLLEKQIDPQALYAYLAFSYVPSPMSILRNVEKIRPSERVVLRNGNLERDIYWRPLAAKPPRGKSEAARELAWRLEKSVRSHLAADVPVAAFLSGGLDSSTIVALARKHADIETFCVSFPGTGMDEAPHAKRVSDHLGTRHHEVALHMDPSRLLMEAVGFMDEPFADSSALPTFAVCRAARNVAKAVLSGDGGDEVFGGYTGRYRVAALKAAVPRPRLLASLLRRVPPWRNGRLSSTPQMLGWAALSEIERYVVERQISTPVQRALLMGKKNHAHYEPMLRCAAEQAMSRADFRHPVHKALWLDLNTSLPDDMLTKVDRMSMAHGLEIRVPLLDHRLVEFALSLPPAWLVSPLPVEGKRLLRDVAGPLLPPGILDRPKQGFVVPLNRWLREGLMDRFEDECLSSNSRVNAWMERKAIVTLRQEPIAERPRQDLYALLVLEQWLRRWGV